jgi:uncharacterized LabA/DUF88 family protein
MPIFSDPSRPPIEYLFIDGAYLREVLNQQSQTYFSGDTITLNFDTLTSGFQKKFYYDCLPPKRSGESREDYESRIKTQIDFYNKLRSLNGFHVFLGTTASEGGRARQKGVDIMIAVHMLTHCFRRNMEKTTLLTGDLDFKPLIESLVQDGMDVTLWFEDISTSKELVYAADSQRDLSVLSLQTYATNDFLQRNPPLKSWLQAGKQIQNLKILKYGKTDRDITVELYEDNAGEFLLLYPDVSNLGYYSHLQNKKLIFIEKFMENNQMSITWESS